MVLFFSGADCYLIAAGQVSGSTCGKLAFGDIEGSNRHQLEKRQQPCEASHQIISLLLKLPFLYLFTFTRYLFTTAMAADDSKEDKAALSALESVESEFVKVNSSLHEPGSLKT